MLAFIMSLHTDGSQPQGMALDSYFFGGHTTHACIYYVSAHGWELAIRAHIQVSNKLLHSRQP